MNPLVLQGAKVVSVAKAKIPLIKTAGKTAISFALTSGTGKELIDKVVQTRERNRIIKDFDEKYEKASSFEERKMIMEYRMQYINQVPDEVVKKCC